MKNLKEQDLSIKLIDVSISMLSTIEFKKTYCESQLRLIKYEKSLLLAEMLLLNYCEKDFTCLGKIELAINYLERKINFFTINDFNK